MFVMLKYQLAFLAVPKTGTTSIEQALRQKADILMRHPPRVKHMTAKTFEEYIRPYLKLIGEENVKTFAVMRKPIDWLESWYFFRRRIDGTGRADPRNSTKDVTWPQFVEAYLSKEPPPYANIGKPARFLGSEDGSDPIVDQYATPNDLSGGTFPFLGRKN